MFYIGKEYQGKDLAHIASEHRAVSIKLLKGLFIGKILFPILVVFAFWGFLNHIFLIGWALFYLVSVAGMWVTLYHWYPRTKLKSKHKIIDKVILSWAVSVSFALMIPMFLFSPNEYPEQAIFFYIITFGTLAGALGLGGYWPIFFIMYSGVSTTAFLIHALISYHEPNYFLVVGVTIFSPFLIHIIITFNRQSAESVVLKKRYAELAKVNEYQKQKAEEMAESRERLLASTSHDLRQPLQAMNFFLASIQENDELKHHKLVERLQLSINGMNDLLGHILELSRLDSDNLKPNIKPVYLSDLINQIKQEYDEQARERDTKIRIEDTDTYVLADSVLLTRIVSNLLSNAVKYTHNGSIDIQYTFTGKTAICLSIQDTGIGIDMDDHKRVFDEFVQVNNPERDKRKGLGLGLSIVKRLSDLMELDLKFDSRPNIGTTVSLQLPLASKQDIEDFNASILNITDTHHQNETSSSGDKVILVIDDEEEIRESLSSLISNWGIKTLVAESASDACKLIERTQVEPHIIISDYRLRDNKNGVDAIKKVKSVCSNDDIPAFLLTGDINTQKSYDPKKEEYLLLQKPIKATQLRSLIQRALA